MYNDTKKLGKYEESFVVMGSRVKKIWDLRFVRFLCIGSFNTLLDFVLLNSLVNIIGLPPLIANSLSVAICVTISYFLNHRIVFRHPQKYSLKSYLQFFLVTGLGALVIQDIVIYGVSQIFRAKAGAVMSIVGFTVSDKALELNAGKALAIIIGLAWNYLLYKYVVFSHTSNTDENSTI